MNATDLEGERRAAESLFRAYRPLRGVYDEFLESDGRPRPHWRSFVQLLDALGSAELERRWQAARRLIHEHGITYNVHGDPEGRDRRWELDALPLIVPRDQWTDLSAGLVQRARLLNAILADLYGPQRLLREGLLPGELVYAQAGFLRPCHGLSAGAHCHLHLYGAHLARSPEGKWWVVADRTQVPIGPGYAVENRIVISRMIPRMFHQLRVERLAGFFIALRETLGSLAPARHGQPHIALLSPGPKSPTYFEDSYLARYLGCTLVEGEDLTVRDHRAFLKTLGGLVGIDALLRRVRDADCDPLELAGGSNAGVPGLLNAVRHGNLLAANAIGSGVLETPALFAFLPAICRRLLGEELQLPSVRTWWCGDERSRDFVLENLETLVVRGATSEAASSPVHAASLDASKREQLAAAIQQAPSRFVAQELVMRSTAPVWSDGALRVGHIALRTFLAAEGDSYRVMPGALAHTSAVPENLGESMFIGHGSKDVWVLAEGPVAAVSLLEPPGTPIEPRRSGIDLPSRVADSLFWLGRHVERGESTARLLRSICAQLISETAPGDLDELALLYRALCAQAPPHRDDDSQDDSVAGIERRVMAFVYDERHPGSLHTILAALARVATVVRDRISFDSWRILQRVGDDFQPSYPPGVVSLADVLATLNQIILDFSAFSGVATENMTRGPGRQFLELGRRIERALAMVGLLRNTLFIPGPNERAVIRSLLEIADSWMTYRNRYTENLQIGPLLDLLVTDETNPRAIVFQLSALADQVERLPRPRAESLLSNEQRLVLEVLSAVRLADVRRLASVDEHGVRRQLDTLLADAAAKLYELADGVSQKYLVHAGPAHQLAEIGWS